MGEAFGLHLMLDGFGCEARKLESEGFIRDFLDQFPENIGMTKLMSPYVSRCCGDDPKQGGLSGFVLIAESHVSVHTFPGDGCVSIDVFSCKSFDTAAAECEIVETFGIKKIETTILDRGVEYPKNVEIAREMVKAERNESALRAVGT